MWLKTTTELRYPTMEEFPRKYDNFYIPNAGLLPTNWDDMSGDAKYDWANEGGHWMSGVWEITENQEKFIESKQLEGTQDEVVIDYEVIANYDGGGNV